LAVELHGPFAPSEIGLRLALRALLAECENKCVRDFQNHCGLFVCGLNLGAAPVTALERAARRIHKLTGWMDKVYELWRRKE